MKANSWLGVTHQLVALNHQQRLKRLVIKEKNLIIPLEPSHQKRKQEKKTRKTAAVQQENVARRRN